MAPGARNRFGAPMFEPDEVFRKQMYCIEGSTCDIVETFRRLPQWFDARIVTRRPGNCAPLPPRYAPDYSTVLLRTNKLSTATVLGCLNETNTACFYPTAFFQIHRTNQDKSLPSFTKLKPWVAAENWLKFINHCGG